MEKQWLGTPPTRCQLSSKPITTEFVDGAVGNFGSWAIIHPSEMDNYGVRLGTGLGQRYELIDGKWLKVEG